MRLYSGGLVLAALLLNPMPQDPVNPPPQNPPPAIGVVLSGMQTTLDLLLKQQQLNRGEHRSLTTKLDRAHAALRHGKPDVVVARLATFADEVQRLDGRGVLDDKTAKPLLDASTSVQQTIAGLLKIPNVTPPVLQLCTAPIPCKSYLVLHVAPHRGLFGVRKPDGSAAAPYPHIGDALARAASDKACGVELVIAAGGYDENIDVNRALRIRGAGAGTSIHGSIRNHGGYPLSVESLALRNSPDPGAIVVDSCPAVTDVSSVIISGAARNGIYQSLGSIRAVDVTVRDTIALADERHAGFGIRLSEAVAVLGELQLLANGAGGLSVEGAAAHAYITASRILNNNLNPYFPVTATDPNVLGTGIVADDSALLLAEFTDLHGNELAGLHVRNAAQAHYRFGQIDRTRQTADGMFGGYNISINDDAAAELESFTSADADLVGLGITRGFASASDGVVSDAPVGIALTPPDGFSGDMLACLRSGLRVILRPDQIPFQGPLTLPCDPELSTCPPPPPCPTVPFECPWCS